jgi:hypothetical protein
MSSLYSFFWVIPQRQILCADVSEHSVDSISIGGVSILPVYMAYEVGPDRLSEHKIQTAENHPPKMNATFNIVNV